MDKKTLGERISRVSETAIGGMSMVALLNEFDTLFADSDDKIALCEGLLTAISEVQSDLAESLNKFDETSIQQIFSAVKMIERDVTKTSEQVSTINDSIAGAGRDLSYTTDLREAQTMAANLDKAVDLLGKKMVGGQR
ncbi:hypothetical protein J8273_4213 [Carpediemonas membranifera]|uniref:Uncharacterized protein n=1 Tax=Carpediemonas membranifera TaxID=201153 RepID=A0A8J6E042_9EUKA|nr:hypothetical protein J8273_4213 [Carpediemonas membranifera]|eukprot:KAG9394539.1 hypothetical protein J8273_4213 [Carpediemonas membranifera]